MTDDRDVVSYRVAVLRAWRGIEGLDRLHFLLHVRSFYGTSGWVVQGCRPTMWGVRIVVELVERDCVRALARIVQSECE